MRACSWCFALAHGARRGKAVRNLFLSMKLTALLSAFILAGLAIITARADDWQPAEGFTSLFNGKDLTGWHYKADPDLDGKTAATDGRYSAAAGVLTVHPHDAAKGPRLRQLWTLREFPKDFILRLEFRASVGADSGIFLRGPQIQCRDYLVAGPYKQLKAYKPQDWNVIEVTVKDGIAHCTCNGEVLEAALKLPATGPIGLEADNATMESRRIQLKELP